jgi:hypothetical protein
MDKSEIKSKPRIEIGKSMIDNQEVLNADWLSDRSHPRVGSYD